MRKLDTFIRDAVSKLPSDVIADLVIFGSAPLAMDRVGIREDIKDLDLFASEQTFEELVRRGFRARVKLKDKVTGEDVLHIVVAGDDADPEIEVLKTFQGVAFGDVHRNAAMHPSGFRIGVLADVRTWKVASGRQKDLDDVAAIDRFLRDVGDTGRR
jgi:hypothetical protein